MGELREQVVLRKSQSGVFMPRGAGIGDVPLTWLIHLLALGRTLCFPHFLLYLVPPELSCRQMHMGGIVIAM